MTYLPPPKSAFDVEWATQNNRIIQQELGRLQPLQVRVADLESGKQPLDGDLTAIAALTGTGYIRRTADDTWAISATIPNTSVTGLGTMSTQNATAVNIDGGAIDGTAIGAATPSTGAFTTLSTTSTATINGNTSITGTLSTTGNAAIGGATLPGSARVGVVGGRTFLGANNEVYALGLSYSATLGNACYIGASNSATPDMIFSNAGGTELVRFGTSGAVSITGTLSASNLAGTTWTPTITAVTNVSGSLAATGQYARVGNTVTGSIRLSLISTSAAGGTQFDLSLPVSSNFTALGDAAGTLSAVEGTTTVLPGYVTADTSNDRLQCFFTAGAATNYSVHVTFAYTAK